MMELPHILLLATTALVASVLSALTGTGGGVLLLPVMVMLFGVRDAIPMYAVAQLLGNLSRVGLNWPYIRREVVLWFALGAVPTAILGAWMFTMAPETPLTRLLGLFLLISVVGQRLMRGYLTSGFSVRWFLPIGSVFAFISALMGSAGPFLAPFYLAFGLVKGAYIGTEAMGTAVMHVIKLLTYHQASALSMTAFLMGVSLGPIMMLGSILGKHLLARMSVGHFVWMVEAVLIVFGLLFLIRG